MTYREWWRRHQFEAVVVALVAVIVVVFAFQYGWISPPSWIRTTSAKIEEKSPIKPAVPPASADKRIDDAAARLERVATSAEFVLQGAAKQAASAASSAASAHRSEANTTASEKRAAAEAVRAEDAARRSEAAAKKAEAAKAAAQAAPKPMAKADKTTARKSLESKPASPIAQEQPAVEPGASGGFRWVHFGTARYATSREEAMRMRQGAFRAMGLPERVVTLLLVATDASSEKAKLTVGDHLDVMLSKGGTAHRNVTVAFASPVHGMEYAAPAEKWSVTDGGKTYTVLLPEVCNNWSLIIGQAPLKELQATTVPVNPVPPVATSEACPQGWTLTANAWRMESLPSDLRRQAETLIAAAEARESNQARLLEPYKPDAVSRTLGKRLREQVRVRAPVSADVTVRFIDPQTAQVVRELGRIRLTDGIGTYRFEQDPRPYVVETIWPASFVSPTISGDLRRIRLFGNEWVGICAMNEHGLVRGN